MNTKRSSLLKYSQTTVAFAMIILGTGYIFFSYYENLQTSQSKYQTLVIQKKEALNQSVEQLYQFLNLTAFRLQNTLNNRERIPYILSYTPVALRRSSFPEIISLIFIAADQPEKVYSRLGIASQSIIPALDFKEDGIIHQGQGTFILNKPLYDENKIRLGTLRAIFSIKHLLYDKIAEEDVAIYSYNERENTSNSFILSFGRADFPFIIAIKHQPPSFWQFLGDSKIKILFVLILAAFALSCGILQGVRLRHILVLQHRSYTKKLRTQLSQLKEVKQDLSTQLETIQNICTLMENSAKEKDLLLLGVQDRYQKMAIEANAINLIVAKLTDQAGMQNKILGEIHCISKESHMIVHQLANGFITKARDEDVDILQAIENVKEIFLPFILESKSIIIIDKQMSATVFTDKVIFEAVLYNILHIIVNRFIKNNTLRILLNGTDPISITFRDDGYDKADKTLKMGKIQEIESIPTLTKDKLSNFVEYLGWQLISQKHGKSSNSLELLIPLSLDVVTLPPNVVNLFEHQSYVD